MHTFRSVISRFLVSSSLCTGSSGCTGPSGGAPDDGSGSELSLLLVVSLAVEYLLGGILDCSRDIRTGGKCALEVRREGKG